MDLRASVAAFGEMVDSNAAAVLVGAGLSLDAGYPSWAALLEPFFDEFELPIGFADLPLLAQHVVNYDGDRARLVEHVVTAINSVPVAPTSNHRLLAQLPIDDMWTTNYDPLIETTTSDCIVLAEDDELVAAGNDGRRIYKMHGSIRPGDALPVGGLDNLVIARDDYEQYPTTHQRMWQLLHAQFLTKSFVFLGFSMTDPNFQAVFRLVRSMRSATYMPHFALLRRGDQPQRAFNAAARDLARIGVHVIEIEQHAEVTEFLELLVARTRPSRLYVAGSEPTPGSDGISVKSSDVYPSSADVSPLLEAAATMLGQKLATAGIKVASGGKVGALVGYELLRTLGDDYDADRAWVLRRVKDEEVTPPNTRLGTIKFTGTEPTELRGSAFDHVRAIVLLGGGAGTTSEADRAVAAGMGIVPIGMTGGAAHSIWAQMNVEIVDVEVGGRPVDPTVFAALNDTDVDVATDAAVLLIKQALFVNDP